MTRETKVFDQLLRAWNGERLIVRHDDETGAWILIAIHSTVLGPAAGGTRMKLYPDLDAALEDVLRLSEGMTYKFATPGLPFGGAKAVVAVPRGLDPSVRLGLLRRFGTVIAELSGVFLTGVDVGTSPADMDVIAETAGPHVFCRTPGAGGAGDPGPYTAVGVFTAIEVACEQLAKPLAASAIVVQGAGNVGGPLIEMLVAAGASVVFSEVKDAVIGRYRDDLGLAFVAPDDVIATECDVYAPCALGGVLDASAIPLLRCRAIAGSANNQLGELLDGERLRERGILYAPDFVANVGGAMAMPGIEHLGWSPEHTEGEIRRYVRRTLTATFAASADEGIATDAAARRIALARLAATS